MDNVTHTLFALTLARTPLGRGGRGTTAALVLASNAPDIDIVATLGGSANYLAWHRGPTHGPLASSAWAGGRWPGLGRETARRAEGPRTERKRQTPRKNGTTKGECDGPVRARLTASLAPAWLHTF